MASRTRVTARSLLAVIVLATTLSGAAASGAQARAAPLDHPDPVRSEAPAELGEMAGEWSTASPPAPRSTRIPSPSGWAWPLVPLPRVVHPFVAPAAAYAPGHRGVDLAALPGAPVLAAGAGVVAFAGRVAGRGVVSVDHAAGLRTTYEPVEATVTRGELVNAGEVLGLLEATESHCTPGSCLHWGLRRGELYLDPLLLVGALRVRLLPVWGPSQ